eukprot:1086023-Amphidinium_carterae.1
MGWSISKGHSLGPGYDCPMASANNTPQTPSPGSTLYYKRWNGVLPTSRTVEASDICLVICCAMTFKRWGQVVDGEPKDPALISSFAAETAEMLHDTFNLGPPETPPKINNQ